MTDEYNLWVIIAEINIFSQLSRNCQIPHTQYYLDNDDMRFIPEASLRASSQIAASSYILEQHL